MVEKLEVKNKNEIIVQQIPVRPSMYNLIDKSQQIKSLHLLMPYGESKSLERVREEDNISYEDIANAPYPIEKLEIVFPDVIVNYNVNGNNFKNEWVFSFTTEREKEEQIKRVKELIKIIE